MIKNSFPRQHNCIVYFDFNGMDREQNRKIEEELKAVLSGKPCDIWENL